MALDTSGLTSAGPTTPLQVLDSLSNGFNYGIDVNSATVIKSSDTIMTGTLSAHGSVVAMAINPGNYKYVSAGTDIEGNEQFTIQPYLTGYLREYWRDPSKCTFGSNSSIPAITGVMPSRYTATPGNALYYIDLQMTRLTGSNYFSNYYFISCFNQMLSWVSSSNTYLVGVNNAQKRNLEYFGFTSYAELLTQGFNRYLIGSALRIALNNIGIMIQQVPSGYFGTSNAVARQLIDSGLGSIGNLSGQINAANIPYSEIYNPIYTQQISAILSTITNASDLQTIQSVIKSTIPNITSALDYTSIEKASGRTNDSVFPLFSQFGRDIYQKSPGFNLNTGKEFVDTLDLLLNQVSQNVEDLATENSLLPPDIINFLKESLPESIDGQAISILNVIGCATGYLLDQLNEVNIGINELDKSVYGPQIRTALNNVASTYKIYAEQYIQVAQSEGGATTSYNPNVLRNFEQAVNQYNSLINTVANDSSMLSIVGRINSNWDKLCESLSIEVINYNKANVVVSSFDDNATIYSFVSTLPTYGLDTESLGTDFFLYSLCQNNTAGDICKSILNQSKNSDKLVNIGTRMRGDV